MHSERREPSVGPADALGASARRAGDRFTRVVVRTASHRLRPIVRATGTLPFVGRGLVAGPPDFVGIGVQRAGTSWWHGLVETHPDVHPLGLAAKELHYFDDRWDAGLDAKAIRRYHRLFARPPGLAAGEWTPRYMHDPWTPALLQRAAPDARLLVLLRDPVRRFRSGLEHARERGMTVTPDLVDDAIARGLYHRQLEGVLRSFRRDRVLVLQYERCVADPGAALRSTFGFLGLAPREAAPVDLGTAVNAARKPGRAAVAPELLTAVTHAYTHDLAGLAADFPEIDLDLWTDAAR